ncbi:Imm42 family immunity protein [Caldalkalibacillus mannanilyticus]|uniref:Imm42 family immunity protein n=1 Tax=Caldalkalibacillus mannanilyticus TaxID=1418 RepID=UPI0004687C35|nr:Imm42 family immunity protein [Caldalkalibacillus mannanilyticus]
MLIGNKSEFGIEYELNKEYGGEWLFGRFCYWIDGKRVGDYDLGTSLRDILFLLQQLIRDNGNRNHEILFKLSLLELFNRLNGGLYSGDPKYDSLAIDESWARFDIGLPIDIFNEWKIFLIEYENKSRFIIQKLGSTENEFLHEVSIESGKFDSVISKAFKLLDELYEKETSITRK